MPTTDQLQTQVDALKQRLTALDGVGAAQPSRAAVPVLQSKASGFQKDLNQLALTIEQIRADLITRYNTWVSTIKTMLGLT